MEDRHIHMPFIDNLVDRNVSLTYVFELTLRTLIILFHIMPFTTVTVELSRPTMLKATYT